MSYPYGGYNPVFGRDPGTTRTLPPGYFPVAGIPDWAVCYQPFFPAPPPYAPAAPAPAPGPILGTTFAVDANGQLYQYISGLNGSGRFPQPPPVIDPDFPAANLINSTGGAGAEPGYNYFFPTEHAKVIVLKCPVAPWTLGPQDPKASIPFHACMVPANVTMAELLAGFGATNPDKEKNQLWEVYPQGGGKWGWKEHCRGDDAVMMARTVRDMGWVEKRDGVLPTVYLWITKS
ncbi:2211c03b-9649-4b6e-bda1-68ee055d1c98 [Thermothielavioides terrestris]|uniref:2211c03b-9649-4b6e-bda1-68ee055d1c98 n=1 Tax=Thermothielavioides terrestris TaxID=2587410 RepID=A0A446BPN6_9PEZI|nr:2211c03b-9649-4b6e-bda1-68ee055d1c98 [Thermothielavioides terrestris]